MKHIKIDSITLSPLLFLLLLPLGNIVSPYLTQSAAHPEITIYKYFIIPVIGFSLGSIIFLGISRNDWGGSPAFSSFIENYTKYILAIITILSIIYFSTLAILRYNSLHTSVFDMGMYDKKIWRISVAPLSKIFDEIAFVHFQPILLLYGLIYKLYDNPSIIQGLQAIAIISGVLPFYLIAKKKFTGQLFPFIFSLIYLLYPPVVFNAALEFHPDHLYVPVMIWAFYLSEKDRHIAAIILSGLAATVKETYILGAAFFGIYLALAKKEYRLGITSFIFFCGTFLIVVFFIMPFLNSADTIDPNAFQILTAENNKIKMFNIRLLTDTLLMWKVRKVLFPYFLLTPLLFLPPLSWRVFLVSSPFFIIPFLSRSSLHSSVDSQYTAGIIAPLLVALLYTIKKIEDRYNEKYACAAIIFSLVMIISFHVAHGPTFLSINFWKPGWAEMWHISNYQTGDHEKVIKKALDKISKDPSKVVISQANINSARLAHRFKHHFFPEQWESSNFILLDIKKPLVVGDYVDEESYRNELNKIKNNPAFQLSFEEDGVLLFERIAER